MIRISKQAYREMIAYCIQQQPHEACGFLSGYRGDSSVSDRIDRFIPVSNRSPRPENHFDMDPREVVSVLYQLETSGAILLGIAHSHPQAPPVPSGEDLLTAWHRTATHWIVSLQGSVPLAKVYRYAALDDGTVAWSGIPMIVED
ncbi:hypothetical protein PAESOLCIP111_02675 [Paenibacillus solanacearum]|uniref:MPN domain-containing protein n=1 Tax=Paenibacillus solanacearum TaxID=2048548 RepID=A0A916K1H0_9BACL|nr:M67 family metallopeptidase [Paenibacillus solanacearum]CAG7624945.1 hypothetical protein PAESOLCIP111_02675 [Paenibacillus solanacearum]